MRRIFLFLLAGMLLFSSEVIAGNYKCVKIGVADAPPRSPSLYFIGVYLDEKTGDLAISPNYDITNLQITITSNGITYLNTTVSLNAGQAYTDCLDFLSEGTYILSLSTSGGVISQYEITVEED